MFADGNALAPSSRATGLRRVPTPVRELLPTKAYTQPAQDNPLPGYGSGEAECCSICLLDFEQNEKVCGRGRCVGVLSWINAITWHLDSDD